MFGLMRVKTHKAIVELMEKALRAALEERTGLLEKIQLLKRRDEANGTVR